MTLYKDKNELSTKTPYYYDRDYRKNTLLKNQNLKIKNTTDLLVTWPPSWITVVNRGLISQASQALSFFSLSVLSFRLLFNAQEQRVKTPRGKEILRGKFRQLARQPNTQKMYCSQVPYIMQSNDQKNNAQRFTFALLIFPVQPILLNS